MTLLVRAARAVSPLAGLSLLCGCPSVNTYGAPRTVPKGEVQHTVALEVHAADGTFTQKTAATSGTPPQTVVTTARREETLVTPSVPTYALRYGLTRVVDLGIRAANFSSLGVDVKWNFAQSERFDAALDPGVQLALIRAATDLDAAGKDVRSTLPVVHLHAPLLLGLNVHENATVVLTPGALFTLAAGGPAITAREALQTSSGVALRLGVGVNLRLDRQLMLQPEVTAVRQLDEGGLTWVTFGFGFSFGSPPRYRPDPLLDGDGAAQGQ